MTVSIIIAVATWQKNLERCVRECLGLEFRDFEILILPDEPIGTVLDNAIPVSVKRTVPVHIIPTGHVNPAAKRDLGLKHAKGEILAFIDDDAYPRKDWLTNAIKNFSKEEVGAVGGPAITPPEDSLMQKVSGFIYASTLTSGTYVYRYIPQQKKEVDDFPSCNLLVRAKIMHQLGGFNTKFWPGEDTKLCLEITHTLKKKIAYDPDVLIYHHRRKFPLAHLAQVANYALHRGYFAKRFPQTSLKFAYFIPSVFVFFLAVGGLLALLFIEIRQLYFFCVTSYLLIILISSIINGLRTKEASGKLLHKASLITLGFVGIITTHVTYGISFVLGLLSPKLKEGR